MGAFNSWTKFGWRILGDKHLFGTYTAPEVYFPSLDVRVLGIGNLRVHTYH